MPFLGIDFNQQDALAQLSQLARVHGIDFGVLIDFLRMRRPVLTVE